MSKEGVALEISNKKLAVALAGAFFLGAGVMGANLDNTEDMTIVYGKEQYTAEAPTAYDAYFTVEAEAAAAESPQDKSTEVIRSAVPDFSQDIVQENSITKIVAAAGAAANDSDITSDTEIISDTVYISSTGKIHKKSGCSGMKSFTEMTMQQAEQNGYTPCKKCCK